VADKPVDPKKQFLQAEHDAMLEKIRQSKGQESSPLLGPDGQPIVKDKDGKPKPEGIVTPGEMGAPASQEEFDELLAKQRQQEREKRDALGKQLQKAFEDNKEFGLVAGHLLTAYRLLFWLMSEAMTHEGVTKDMINHLSDSCRASAMNQGYSLQELIGTIRGNLVPMLNGRMQYYSRKQKARQAKIKQIEKRIGAKGVALPCLSMERMFKDKDGNLSGFRPGSIMLVHGSPLAITYALAACAKSHKEKNNGESWFLQRVNEKDEHDYITFMPCKWWKHKAQSYKELEETLEPIRKSGAVLVLIDQLDLLHPHDGTLQSQSRAGAKALGNLYQWATENCVCFIIGDVVGDDVTVPPEAYSPLPHLPVALRNVEGEQKLVIGNDVMDIDL